jgi:hypothetical protein
MLFPSLGWGISLSLSLYISSFNFTKCAGRIILKMLIKYDGAWTGFIGCRTAIGGGLLWIRQWKFWFYKWLGISSLAELLLAYRELRLKQFAVQQKFHKFGYGLSPHSNLMLLAHEKDATSALWRCRNNSAINSVLGCSQRRSLPMQNHAGSDCENRLLVVHVGHVQCSHSVIASECRNVFISYS